MLHTAPAWEFPSLHFACNTSGPDSPAQLVEDRRYSTVIFEFRHEMDVLPWDHEEQVLSNAAAALRNYPQHAAVPPAAWVYRNSGSAGEMFATERAVMTDPTKDSWFLAKQSSWWRPWDFRSPECADFYINDVVRPIAEDPAVVGGVFFDNVFGGCGSPVPLDQMRGFFDATMGVLKRACTLLNHQNKSCMLSIINAFDAAHGPRNATDCTFSEDAVAAAMGPVPWTRYYEHFMNGF